MLIFQGVRSHGAWQIGIRKCVFMGMGVHAILSSLVREERPQLVLVGGVRTVWGKVASTVRILATEGTDPQGLQKMDSLLRRQVGSRVRGHLNLELRL